MLLTSRDLDFLRHLRRYWYLRTNQIRDRLVPHDKDGSITRGRLRKLEQAGYVKRYQPRHVDPQDGATAAPVFVLTFKGANALVVGTDDPSLALEYEATFAQWMSINHYCRLASVAAKIDDAFAAQDHATLHALYFEHDVVKPAASDPSQRFRLYQVVNHEPKQVSIPDVAVEFEVSGWRRCLLFEYETGADGSPKRIADKKQPGVAGLARTQLWKKYAPRSRDFRCLALCPTDSWRDHMRAALKGQAGAEYWLFATTSALTPETFLYGDIIYTVDKGPVPLVPPPAGLSVEIAGAG